MKKVVLLVLDGYGLRNEVKGNAIEIASKPNLDRMFNDCPNTKLKASGLDVGLPKDVMGNSEAGHENLGAGRVVEQYFNVISRDIQTKDFFKKEPLLKAMKSGKVHLMGLISDGGVHTYIDHLFALIDLAKKCKAKVFLHAFLDGRDMLPRSALSLLKQVHKKLEGVGEISTVSGRFYAMDRDNRWDRTEKAYNNLVKANGLKFKDFESCIKQTYAKGEYDEFVVPSVVSKSFTGIKDHDSVIFFNFREDRARQLTEAFTSDDFKAFKRKKVKTYFVAMTRYDKDIKADVVYEREVQENVLGKVLEDASVKQLRISETEKYAHVTYFFDNGREEPFKNSDWVIVQSPRVRTYDLKPEMSSYEVTEKVVKALNSQKYEFILVNLNNCDMVGHTGNMLATVKGVEVVDECIGLLSNSCKKNGFVLVVTADHGNAELKVDDKGRVRTDHTTNEVPLIIEHFPCTLRSSGKLGDVAPTILKIMGIKIPLEMTGNVLIKTL